MTLQTLLALNHSAPIAVRLLLDIEVKERYRLLLRDSFTKGAVRQYQGFHEVVVACHIDTWAEWKEQAAPLREAFLRAIGGERGGAA